VARRIAFYKNFFPDFYSSQDKKTKEKVNYVLDMLRFEERVPSKFFKLLKNSDGIWEIRIITHQNSFRILCFKDGGEIIVLVNTFIKKTQKTPRKEIKQAEKLKREFLNEKYGTE
jgi:phage-related protein